jgi:hypothetical protein
MGLRNLGTTGIYWLDDLYQSLGCRFLIFSPRKDIDFGGHIGRDIPIFVQSIIGSEVINRNDIHSLGP